ncbi:MULTISPECIES: nitrogen fixation protein NifZ [Mesorhizobium]|uniref:nitrogen fixation protein NifZ n=1 Tax=Mesorhizobium TaxID=68287 RepID=UPI0010A9558F|nr:MULTISPECIES: nitrogen fixation protein NifZ [Mesorhizobium]
MSLGREQDIEIRTPPRFMPGERVRATRHIKNDGTYPGKEIGENLVRKGDEGYVRDIGTFLQQFYIYAVEWVDRGTVVGMRARELMSLETARTPSSAQIGAGFSKGTAR